MGAVDALGPFSLYTLNIVLFVFVLSVASLFTVYLFSLIRLCLSDQIPYDVTCLEWSGVSACVTFDDLSLLLLSPCCISSYILQSTHYILEYVCNAFSVQILSFFYILNKSKFSNMPC